MGFLRRLFGGRVEPNSTHAETAPGSGDLPSQRGRAPAPPLPGNLVPPELPRIPMPELPPKAERPYRSTICPNCGAELSPLPRAKKACPSCHQPIFVRGAADGFIDLIREPDLVAWDQEDLRRRADAYETHEAKVRTALKAAGFLVGEDGWSVEVVGESHYQRTLERLAGGRSEQGANLECVARLVREPTNRYDRNAVRIEIQGELVGYVSRDQAEDVQPLLQKLDRQGRPAWVRATINGGWEDADSRGSFGVVLDDLPDEDEV